MRYSVLYTLYPLPTIHNIPSRTNKFRPLLIINKAPAIVGKFVRLFVGYVVSSRALQKEG